MQNLLFAPPNALPKAEPPVAPPPAGPETPAPPKPPAAPKTAVPPLVDRSLVETVAPMALSTLAAAPMLASSLAGMLGGGAGGGGAGTAAPTSDHVLKVIDALEALYGSGGAAAGAAGTGAGIAADGTVPDPYLRRQLFLQNRLAAIGNLDGQLNTYMTALAKGNQATAAALKQIRIDMLTQIAALGDSAMTPAGEKQKDEIVARGLRKAHALVGSSEAKAAEIAAQVDRLTDQYGADLRQPKSDMHPAARAAIAEAMKHLGKRYKRNTTGPINFDCSGLTKVALAAAGKKVTHNAFAQYRETWPVDPRSIKPGDLIYPDAQWNKRVPGGPGHVQMFIGNYNGVPSVIHAGDPVQISPLPKGYRATRWVE
ncbi:DUF4226 domain-containing protein [Nocardia sp. NPDC051832]|uniref:C40 family peptidase n=1 Tax=Nocardia sp. NPDC051832 TaxID=3155673 RepID=UPI00341E7D51